MNERITELAFRASENYDYHPEFAKKFAELIVKECAGVAEEVDGDSRARKCVLEHFGVK